MAFRLQPDLGDGKRRHKTLRFSRAGKQIISGGITLGTTQALALAAAGFDDDEPPEFVRERSLIIPIGEKKYVQPDAAWLSRHPEHWSREHRVCAGWIRKPVDHTMRLAAVFAEAFNSMGSAGFSIQTIAPTPPDPLVALSENKDWTGKPIAKEDFSKLSPAPGFSQNKDTASDPSKWIAEAINNLSGGSKSSSGVFSLTADQTDYLVGQLTGRGRAGARQSGTVDQGNPYRGRFAAHNIPLVGGFYGNSEAQSSQGTPPTPTSNASKRWRPR